MDNSILEKFHTYVVKISNKLSHLPRPKHIIIGIRHAFLKAQRSGHGHDLPAMVGAVIDDMHDVFETLEIVFCPRHIQK